VIVSQYLRKKFNTLCFEKADKIKFNNDLRFEYGIQNPIFDIHYLEHLGITKKQINYIRDIINIDDYFYPICDREIKYQYWDNTDNTGIDTKRESLISKNKPTGFYYITKVEGPVDWKDHFCAKICGYLCPPVSNRYTFWLSSDDQAEFWLSMNDNSNDIQKISQVNDYTNFRDWFVYQNQKSIEFYLEKGNKYYFEVIYTDFELSDHVSLGWSLYNHIPLVISDSFISSIK
jgi:hypothetical protein